MLRERSASTTSVALCLRVLVKTRAGRSMAITANAITATRNASKTPRRRGVSLCRGSPRKVKSNTSASATMLVIA